MTRKIFTLTLMALAVFAQVPDDANFYRSLNDGKSIGEMLPAYLRVQADSLLAQRRTRLEQTTDWSNYRQSYRRALLQSLGGPFPEKTPLNPTVTGVIQRQGFRIEKIVFESQPRFYVTANLYVPSTGKAPYPAILFPLGHETGAKAHDAWQIVISNLALRGFVVLAWDPIGQGERIQMWDDDFQGSKLVQSTTEHTMQGIQTLLVGDALARYTIWDGIRALDYLLTRPEVDRARVGITGNSGGGTHTSYIASLEDRIHAAAPSCYLTSWKRLLDTIGPQDAEQCFPGWLAAGYDHPDFVLSFAPRPFLMLSAIRDFFSIAGARETAAEAARVYDSLGASSRFGKFEADDGHGYTQPRREAAYRFFTEHLQQTQDTSPERSISILGERELNVTTSGQIATSLKGLTVHDLNLARWKQLRQPGTLDDVRKLTRFVPRLQSPKVQNFGQVVLPGGVRMQKLTFETEPGIIVPSLLFLPSVEGPRPATIIVHGRGKAAARESAIARAKAGEVALAIDLRGMGETVSSRVKSSDWQRLFGDYDSAMTAILLGKPLVAMRAEDISSAVSLLASRPDVKTVQLEAIGQASIPALYAMALDTRIAAAHLDGLLVSYESAIRRRVHRSVFEHIVVGALRYYDLPDLIRWASPRRVTVRNKVDSLGNPID